MPAAHSFCAEELFTSSGSAMCCDLLEHVDRIEANITEYDQICPA